MEEETSVRDQALGQLRQCEGLVRRLFEAIDRMLSGRTLPETTLTPEQIMEKLIETQSALRKTFDNLKTHQSTHERITKLRAAVEAENTKIAQLGATLRQAETKLQDALDKARPRIKAMERANQKPVDVDEVVSYGKKVSASLSAPPGWDTSQPLGKYLPPAPTETMMRAGRLAQMASEQ